MTTRRYDNFRKEMNDKYQGRFGEEFVIHDGIIPERKVESGVGGYTFAFRHPDPIMEPIAYFSDRIARTVPATTCDGMTIHTSLAGMLFPEGESTPDESVLKRMCEIAHDVHSRGLFHEFHPWISYRGDPQKVWLYNSEAVVVAGQPNNSFIDVSDALVRLGRDRDLDMTSAWAAHITASRFTRKRGLEKLADFRNLIKTAPALGDSQMQFLDVLHFYLDKSGLKIEIYERFE